MTATARDFSSEKLGVQGIPSAVLRATIHLPITAIEYCCKVEVNDRVVVHGHVLVLCLEMGVFQMIVPWVDPWQTGSTTMAVRAFHASSDSGFTLYLLKIHNVVAEV